MAGERSGEKKGSGEASKVAEEAKQRLTVVVDAGTSLQELLQMESEGNIDFVFDPKAMPSYADEDVADFGHELKRSYFLAVGARKRESDERALRDKHKEKPPQLWVDDPFDRVATKSDRLVQERERKHRGWHATWIRNDQMDAFKEVGYKNVREALDGDEVGAERGEVIKINESDRITIYLVEIPMEVYEQTLKVASYRSQVRYSADTENTYREYIEGVNRDIGAKREVITPVVEKSEGNELVTAG